MEVLYIGGLLLAIMLVLLSGGVWIAMTLAICGWVGQAFFTSTEPGKNLFSAFWESNASWELAALPLFIWMGEILFRTRLSEEMFRGLSPWLQWLPGQWLVCCDLRNDCQSGTAGVEAPRVQRGYRVGFARHCRNPGHSDTAIHHHGGVRRGGRCFHHPYFPGGVYPSHGTDGTVHELHHVVVHPPSGPGPCG